MYLYNKFETTLANFTILKNNKVEKKFKKEYQHLFKPNIFANLEQVNHVNLIQLHKIDEINKTLTYEYFDSKTLREKLKIPNRISYKNLIKIFKQMALSIDYLHKNNIAHIDINDTNFLINESLKIKLNDYDFIEILNEENQFLKQIDILSFATLIYRIIKLPYQWNAIRHMAFKFNIDNVNYLSCEDFLSSLRIDLK